MPATDPFAASSTALFRWLFSTAMLIVMCSCEVLITNQNYSLTLAHFNSMSASFGISLPNDGLHGAAIAAKPSRYGCLRLDPPPAEPKNM